MISPAMLYACGATALLTVLLRLTLVRWQAPPPAWLGVWTLLLVAIGEGVTTEFAVSLLLMVLPFYKAVLLADAGLALWRTVRAPKPAGRGPAVAWAAVAFLVGVSLWKPIYPALILLRCQGELDAHYASRRPDEQRREQVACGGRPLRISKGGVALILSSDPSGASGIVRNDPAQAGSPAGPLFNLAASFPLWGGWSIQVED